MLYIVLFDVATCLLVIAFTRMYIVLYQSFQFRFCNCATVITTLMITFAVWVWRFTYGQIKLSILLQFHSLPTLLNAEMYILFIFFIGNRRTEISIKILENCELKLFNSRWHLINFFNVLHDFQKHKPYMIKHLKYTISHNTFCLQSMYVFYSIPINVSDCNV